MEVLMVTSEQVWYPIPTLMLSYPHPFLLIETLHDPSMASYALLFCDEWHDVSTATSCIASSHGHRPPFPHSGCASSRNASDHPPPCGSQVGALAQATGLRRVPVDQLTTCRGFVGPLSAVARMLLPAVELMTGSELKVAAFEAFITMLQEHLGANNDDKFFLPTGEVRITRKGNAMLAFPRSCSTPCGVPPVVVFSSYFADKEKRKLRHADVMG